MVAANMSGTEKLPLLVIGKFENPRCFKGIKSLPVIYRANKKAWMVSFIFEEWLRNLDRRFLREKRKVLLFVDNCAAHPKVLNLKSITLNFLPPNTSLLQPMDQGIINNLKIKYRQRLIKYILQVRLHLYYLLFPRVQVPVYIPGHSMQVVTCAYRSITLLSLIDKQTFLLFPSCASTVMYPGSMDLIRHVCLSQHNVTFFN